MKKILVLIIGLLLCTQTCYSQLQSKVDERFELVSIMFALGGAPEFCDCKIPSYWQDMIAEFKPLDRTAPIDYIRELHQIHLIGFDAAMMAADVLEIRNGRIQLKSQYDISEISNLDARWNEKLFSKFIKKTNEFYKQSKFHEFYSEHRKLIETVEHRMNESFDKSLIEWTDLFFGNSVNADLNFYISLANGPHNYSIPSGILLGVNGDVERGENPMSSLFMFTVAHELAHHYTNPLVESYWHELKASSDKIYPYIKNDMAKYSYTGSYTTMIEGLNNLFALMYLKETGNGWFNAQLGKLMQRGFIWMERGVRFMDNFYANRDRYPHIKDFMPQLIAFVNFTADNFDMVIEEHKNNNPYITNVFPAIGSDISGFKEVIITFSEPMLGSMGYNGTGVEDPGIQPLYFDEAEWSEDHRQLKIRLISEMITPNGVYALQLRPDYFRSSLYYNLHDKYKNLIFNTGKE